MTRIFFFIIANILVNKSLLAQENNNDTIEAIGKHLSELLIHRDNITESHYAIDIERLFPDEDFSKFEDSPAAFILAMLYGAQLILPETWNDLLLQADSLNLTNIANYFKTYSKEEQMDNLLLSCVLEQSSKYYVFNVRMMRWEKDYYLLRIYKQMKEYTKIEEFQNNLFRIAIDEEMAEFREFEEQMQNMLKPTVDTSMCNTRTPKYR